MKNPAEAFCLIFVIALIAIGCKKEDVVPPFDPATLNGTWTGTSTIKKKGLCTFSDSISTVSQKWLVKPDGTVTITETFTYATSSGTFNWTGFVDKARNISITRTQYTNCFGTVADKSFTLNGKIDVTSAGLSLDEEMDFPLCPPNCLFSQHYVLTK